MPKYNVHERASIDLEKTIKIPRSKEQTKTRIKELAISQNLDVPRDVAEGYTLKDVKHTAEAEDYGSHWEVTVYATMTVDGKRISEAEDARTAAEIAAEEAFELGSEATEFYFPFVRGDIAGGWKTDKELTFKVVGVPKAYTPGDETAPAFAQ